MIKCLVCGKSFTFLPAHLRVHGIDAAEYRREYQIPASVPLASQDYCEFHAQKFRRMQRDGTITYDHLPKAVESARHSGKGQKTAEDRSKHIALMKKSKPWSAHQIPPGGKRADGRDADKAREYQREYRKRKAKK